MSSAVLHLDTGGNAYDDLVLDWGGALYRYLDIYLDGARNAGDLYSDSGAAPGWKWGRYAVYNGVAEWTGEYVVRWINSAQPQGAPISPSGHPGITDPYPNYLSIQGWLRIPTAPSGATIIAIPSGTAAIAGLVPGYLVCPQTRTLHWYRATPHLDLPAGHTLLSTGPQYLYGGQARNPARYEYGCALDTLGLILHLPAPGTILRLSPTATPRLEINGQHHDLWTQTGAGEDDYVGLASDGCVFDGSNTVVSPPPSPGRSVLPFEIVDGILQP